MTSKHRFKVEKLIRDKMPDIIRQHGIEGCFRIMELKEYISCLKAKVLEEADEVATAANLSELREELGDLLEVMLTLASCYNLTLEDIQAAAAEKRAVKGGFEGRVYNEFVEMTAENAYFERYRSLPHKYPEVKV